MNAGKLAELTGAEYRCIDRTRAEQEQEALRRVDSRRTAREREMPDWVSRVSYEEPGRASVEVTRLQGRQQFDCY